MKKQFMVPQPPLTKQYTFLVDEISNNANWGQTTDIDKINFNRKLLGEELNIDLKVKLLFVENGISVVLPLGRFITIIQIKDGEEEGIMTFYDFDTRLQEIDLRKMIGKIYSENITNEWIQVYKLLLSEFKEADDLIRLQKL